ncbi:MAG: winged helix DNA-binding protein [Gammaproteobacteria bacterium]|nr:winged helix DNA-binding protein [Gammaproteobacteria bacterium]
MTTDQPTARLLLKLFRDFEQTLLEQLAAHNITDVAPSHLNILRHLNNEGMMISQLAHDAALSKQLVGRVVQELAAKHYLMITEDQKDRRIKYVNYTDKGTRLISHAVEIVNAIELQYERALGKTAYNQFRSTITQLSAIHSKQEKDNA